MGVYLAMLESQTCVIFLNTMVLHPCCREYWAFQVNNAPLMDGPLDKMDSTQHEYNSFCERGR